VKPAATLTAFAVGLAAVFGAAYTTGGAVPALTDPAPTVVTPHDPPSPDPAPPATPGGSGDGERHPDSDPTGDGHRR